MVFYQQSISTCGKCLYVRVTSLQRSITKKKVNDAHNLLTMFCSTYTKRFGKEFCTPNMHLHLYVKDSILDFGPIYGWLCMSFDFYFILFFFILRPLFFPL